MGNDCSACGNCERPEKNEFSSAGDVNGGATGGVSTTNPYDHLAVN